MKFSRLLLPLTMAVAACGASDLSKPAAQSADASTPEAQGVDAASPDARSVDASQPDAQSLFAVDDAVVQVTLSLAFLGGVPICSAYTTRSVTYTRATQTAEWSGCTLDAGAGWPASSKKLDSAEAQSVETALKAITFTPRSTKDPACPMDGREYFMRTTDRSNNEVMYSQYNTNCYNYRAAILNEAFDLLMSLK